MNHFTPFKQSSGIKPPGTLAIGIAILGFLGCGQRAHAQFAIGDASNYAVIYAGSAGSGTNNQLLINSGPISGNTITGVGNAIGLGDEGGGTSQVSIINPAVYNNGAINFAGAVTTGSVSAALTNTTLSGGVSQVEADLDSLNVLSAAFTNEAGAGTTINLATSGATQTINASAGTPDATGNEVFAVSSVNFVHGSTLTINGTFGQNVVLNINLSANVTFGGNIQLTGGLTSDQVLFNITGSGTFTDGVPEVFTSQDAHQQGIFLDPNGTIQIDGVNLNGRVFGGEGGDMAISSGGNINAPAQDPGFYGSIAEIPEPSTYALLAIGLGGLWLAMRRRRVGTQLPGLLAAGMVLLGFLGSSQTARAGFTLGDASNYAVIFEGVGTNQLQINSGTYPGNPETITGWIGLAAEPNDTSTPQLDLGNPAIYTNGKVNFAGPINNNSNATMTNTTITGSVAQVEADMNSLNTLSTTLGGETGSGTTINIGNNQTQTINASAGTLDTHGNEIFTVSSVSFVNGATLIINGSASQYVVLNFNQNEHFSGTITLTGGITSDQVLFNVTGGMDLTGGDTLQTAANDVVQHVTYLDPNGTIQLNSVDLEGRVFGGDSSNMQIVSGGIVDAPPASGNGMAMIPEPSTYALGIVGVAMLLGFRRMRRSRA